MNFLWTLPATVGGYDDGAPLPRAAVFDAIPELMGHGETDDEAIEDLCEQMDALTWH